MKIPKHVRLVDVGPRDGLQNEQAVVPTDVKVALIDLLSDAGFPAVEATAFVSPKWVPQMADASDVMARIRRKPGVRYPDRAITRPSTPRAARAAVDGSPGTETGHAV